MILTQKMMRSLRISRALSMTSPVPDSQTTQTQVFDPRSPTGPDTLGVASGHNCAAKLGGLGRQAHACSMLRASTPRDAVVVVPVGAVLPLARQAWSRTIGVGCRPSIPWLHCSARIPGATQRGGRDPHRVAMPWPIGILKPVRSW